MAQQKELLYPVSRQIYFIYLLKILDDELVFNDIVKHRHIVEDHPVEVNIAINEIRPPGKKDVLPGEYRHIQCTHCHCKEEILLPGFGSTH